MSSPSSLPSGRLPRCLVLLLAAGLAAGCDRREQAVEGDLSPETGVTTPAPQETPPSDPASGSATTAPDDATEDSARAEADH